MTENNDLEDSDRDVFCSSESQLAVQLYISGMSYSRYSEMIAEDREFILGVYGHIRECVSCREGYDYLKELFSTEKRAPSSFSEEQFRLLRENERYLERLV